MKRALIVVAMCVAAFLVGRSIPRTTPARAASDAPAAAAGPAAAGGTDDTAAASSFVPSAASGQLAASSDTGASGSAEATPLPQASPPTVEDRVPREWREAVRAQPAQANAVKQLVIQAMHVRADPAAIRECLRGDGISGALLLRFEIDVESETDELRVGGARFVEALEGPPISDAAGRCIAQLFEGEDPHEGQDLLDGYVGPVDYQLAINVPTAR